MNAIASFSANYREFQGLAEVPPAAEWFANLDNANTRRSYQEFIRFVGISAPAELRLVTLHPGSSQELLADYLQGRLARPCPSSDPSRTLKVLSIRR